MEDKEKLWTKDFCFGYYYQFFGVFESLDDPVNLSVFY